MKYAVISDIHGNYPALKAVLDDAKSMSVDGIIFVGDYVIDLPYPNEVINTIKNCANAHVIKGNRDGYFDNLDEKTEERAKYDQMAPLAWNENVITKPNREYLLKLPKTIKIPVGNGKDIIVHHNLQEILKSKLGNHNKSSLYSKRMQKEPFTKADNNEFIKTGVLSDEIAVSTIKSLDAGIIISGHSHIQWDIEIGNTVLLNPGSCGIPMDYDSYAPYSIIELSNSAWKVEHRKVSYDILELIENTKESSFYKAAPIWCEIVFKELIERRDYISFFFYTVKEVSNELNMHTSPVDNIVWRRAAGKWGISY